MKKIWSGLIYTFFIFMGFLLVSSLSAMLQYDHELVINLDNFVLSMKTTLTQIRDFSTLRIPWGESSRTYPVTEVFTQSYGYSFLILLSSFILAIVVSIMLSYAFMLLPNKGRSGISRLLDGLDALPDVFIVVLLQLFIIWLYKQTGFLLFNIYSLGEDRIYVLPIVCLAVLPVTYLLKHFIYQLREEETKPYIAFSYSKGFSKPYTLWVHLFRNVWIHFFYHSKPVFLLMLSNLLIIELLFNIHGFMKALLFASTASPPAFLLGMVLLVLPFYAIYAFGSLCLKTWLKEGTTVE